MSAKIGKRLVSKLNSLKVPEEASWFRLYFRLAGSSDKIHMTCPKMEGGLIVADNACLDPDEVVWFQFRACISNDYGIEISI